MNLEGRRTMRRGDGANESIRNHQFLCVSAPLTAVGIVFSAVKTKERYCIFFDQSRLRISIGMQTF